MTTVTVSAADLMSILLLNKFSDRLNDSDTFTDFRVSLDSKDLTFVEIIYTIINYYFCINK